MRNDGCSYTSRVGPEDAGATLVEYLGRRFAHTSEDGWHGRILDGRVEVNGGPATAGQRVAVGATVVWHRPPWDEPEAPLGFAVLHDDEGVVAVAKPAGLPTLPGGAFFESTLLRRLRRYDARLAPMHRLGRFTSGIVLCARGADARESLRRGFAERRVRKTYLALAEGRPASDAFVVDVPIGPVPHRRLGTCHGASPAGRPAASRVRVLERRGEGFLCEVTIATGRPHQIRIHLAAAGHPLVGDRLYRAGGLPAGDTLPGDGGYRLHAWKVGFEAPRTATAVQVECAPPPPLRPSPGS